MAKTTPDLLALAGPLRWAACAAALAAALLAGGCESPPSAQFVLNIEGRAPESVSLAQRQAISQALEDLFGTPDYPKIPAGVKLDLGFLEMAGGPIGRDRQGNKRGLYRQHCVSCHGVTGDGAGALAILFDPYPRDFRLGVFKYTSTIAGAKPVRGDLVQTLLRGIPGTGMPTYIELPMEELDALVEYVKYLSLRGQTELYLLQLVVDEDEYVPLGAIAMEMVMEEGVLAAAESWNIVEEHQSEYVIRPAPQPATATPESLAASLALGRKLYASKDAQCVSCHGPEGAGNGENQELYDDWNKPKLGVGPEQTAELAKLFTLPIQRLRARNFLQGIFHGGSRPEDLYRRVHAGIKGTPMPAAGASPGVKGVFTPEEMGHVVNFVLSLSGRR